MKCENCPALTDVGTYEYPEYSCYLMNDDDVVEFKDGSIGCSRKSYKKIVEDMKKESEILDKATKDYYEGFVAFMNKEENKQ